HGRNHLQVRAWVEPDGSCRIERLKPGPFRLRISRLLLTPNEIVLPPPVSYAEVDIQLEMPADQKSLRYDVTLRRNSHIYGRVLDKDGKPLTDRISHRQIWAEPEDEGLPISTLLNRKGEFLLHVPPHKEYKIKVLLVDNGKRSEYKFDNVTPPVEGLFLQIGKDESASQ
ncbi:MAG: hypothetical protein ABIH23_28320, partial [bacterium]